jgi:hypothetical protein
MRSHNFMPRVIHGVEFLCFCRVACVGVLLSRYLKTDQNKSSGISGLLVYAMFTRQFRHEISRNKLANLFQYCKLVFKLDYMVALRVSGQTLGVIRSCLVFNFLSSCGMPVFFNLKFEL